MRKPRFTTHGAAVLALILWTAISADHCRATTTVDETPLIGTFTILNRRSPYLIAAPHGEYDDNTGAIVWTVCQNIQWDCLIVEGFRRARAPINVNRPTEGTSKAETHFTERAALVYAKYLANIRKISPRVQFYVEIHGNEYEGSKDLIEVATVEISPQKARKILGIMNAALKAEKLEHLQVRIDALEKIRFKASHARKFGVLAFIKPAIHIEFPLDARTNKKGRTEQFLIRALPELARAIK